MVEKEAQNIDDMRAQQKHSNYGHNWLKAEEKKKQIVHLKSNTILDDGSRRRTWRKEAKRFGEELKKLKRDKNKAVRPIQEILEIVLQKHKIEKHAYHGENL